MVFFDFLYRTSRTVPPDPLNVLTLSAFAPLGMHKAAPASDTVLPADSFLLV